MAVTTQDAIYRGILLRLQTQLTLDDAFIYVAPQPVFSQMASQSVQIIPGVPIARNPEGGPGDVTEDFTVATWSKLNLDQQGKSTVRITGDTLGLLLLTNGVRGNLIQHRLTSDGTALLTNFPITWIQGSAMIESGTSPGWTYSQDTYRVRYEIGWPT